MSPVGKVGSNFWESAQSSSVRWKEKKEKIQKDEVQKHDIRVFDAAERRIRPEEQPEIVRALLEKNLSLEFIQEATGLPKDKILSLR
jgi:hypothetical protein